MNSVLVHFYHESKHECLLQLSHESLSNIFVISAVKHQICSVGILLINCIFLRDASNGINFLYIYFLASLESFELLCVCQEPFAFPHRLTVKL